MKERPILMIFAEQQRCVEIFTVALSCDMFRLIYPIKEFNHPVNTDYLMLQQRCSLIL